MQGCFLAICMIIVFPLILLSDRPLFSENTTVKFVGAGKKHPRLCKCSRGSKKFASGENNEAGEAVGLT